MNQRHTSNPATSRSPLGPRRTAALACCLTLLFSARADTVVLTSVADSEIRQFSPDSNFGSDPSMASGKLGAAANGELRRGLFRFDLSGQVPPGALVQSASLTVTVVNVPLTPVNSTFDVRPLLLPWIETAVT